MVPTTLLILVLGQVISIQTFSQPANVEENVYCLYCSTSETYTPKLPAFELELTCRKVKPGIAILKVRFSLIFVSVNAII